jgi:hypothetical protein
VIGLPEAELTALYAEPSVADYRPQVTAELADGRSVAALCFNLPPSGGPVEPNPVRGGIAGAGAALGPAGGLYRGRPLD